MKAVPSKYHRKIDRNDQGDSDVYDVLQAFAVTSAPIAHAIKKLLLPGERHAKTRLQDLNEAAYSIQRAIEQERAASGKVL